MTQAIDDDPDGDTPTQFDCTVEYAVNTEGEHADSLRAWAWVAGESPGFYAGHLLRQLRDAEEQEEDATAEDGAIRPR